MTAKKRSGLSLAHLVGGAIAGAGRFIALLFGSHVGMRAAGYAASQLPPIVTVRTKKGAIRFWCASSTAGKLASNFLKHEPDTRDWIDAVLASGDHLWDIGANIGLYTLYAAQTSGVTVTSFEPVPGTFAILSRNIALNALESRVTPLCLALSDKNASMPIYLASADPGAAMHGLGVAETMRGAFDPVAAPIVLTARGDTLLSHFHLPQPSHIKIDVDGHEAHVLQGLEGVLPKVKSLWIEMTEAADASEENARIDAFLKSKGFEVSSLPNAHKGRNRLYRNTNDPLR